MASTAGWDGLGVDKTPAGFGDRDGASMHSAVDCWCGPQVVHVPAVTR